MPNYLEDPWIQGTLESPDGEDEVAGEFVVAGTYLYFRETENDPEVTLIYQGTRIRMVAEVAYNLIYDYQEKRKPRESHLAPSGETWQTEVENWFLAREETWDRGEWTIVDEFDLYMDFGIPTGDGKSKRTRVEIKNAIKKCVADGMLEAFYPYPNSKQLYYGFPGAEERFKKELKAKARKKRKKKVEEE
jgi:outer membrane receptor for ferrienterochelin and colicin